MVPRHLSYAIFHWGHWSVEHFKSHQHRDYLIWCRQLLAWSHTDDIQCVSAKTARLQILRASDRPTRTAWARRNSLFWLLDGYVRKRFTVPLQQHRCCFPNALPETASGELVTTVLYPLQAANIGNDLGDTHCHCAMVTALLKQRNDSLFTAIDFMYTASFNEMT